MLKLAFSTLGCPDWSWDEIFAAASDLGYDGIEVRGIDSEIFSPSGHPFTDKNIEKTKARLAAAGLSIPVLASSVALAEDENGAGPVLRAKEYIDIAHKLGTPFVRLMYTGGPHPEGGNFDAAVGRYRQLCEYAAEKNVTPLIETNGLMANSANMLDFIQKSGCENSGILWDVHHPFRYFDESPQDTAKTLGGYVRHVHVKDSLMQDGLVKYKMMGYGDVPVRDCVDALKAHGYDGYISLEWVRRWNPELEESGIVLPHFIGYMKRLI